MVEVVVLVVRKVVVVASSLVEEVVDVKKMILDSADSVELVSAAGWHMCRVAGWTLHL